VRLIEQTTEVFSIEVSVAEDPAERPALDLLVQRHDEGIATADLLQADVAAALTDNFPAVYFQCLDKALAGTTG